MANEDVNIDNIDIYKFCELVKSYPCLYDTSRDDYKDITKKRNVWNSVAKILFPERSGKELENTAKALKNKLKTMRYGFSRSLKKKSGSERENDSNYKYAKEMLFMLPFLKHRDTESNMPRR